MENWRKHLSETENKKNEIAGLTMAIAENFLNSCVQSVQSAALQMHKAYKCKFVTSRNSGTHVRDDIKNTIHNVTFGAKGIKFEFLKGDGFKAYEMLVKQDPKKENQINEIIGLQGLKAFKTFLGSQSAAANLGNTGITVGYNSMFIDATLKIKPCGLVEDWHPSSSWSTKGINRLENLFYTDQSDRWSSGANWMDLDSDLSRLFR